MARLFLRIGRRDKVRPADFVGAIANEAHLPGDAVGDIDIYDTFSFIEVPEPVAERILRALNRTTIRGRDPQATLARPIDDGARRDAELRPMRPGRATHPPLMPRRPTLPPRRGAGRFGTERPPLRRKPTTRRERERRS